MDQDDLNPSPTPDGFDPLEPRIVEATRVPEYSGEEPIVASTVPIEPVAYVSDPTEVIPVVDRVVTPVGGPMPKPPATAVYTRPGPHPAWPYFIGLVALLLGGLIGFLIADARNDDETLTSAPAASVPASDTTETLDILLTRTRQDGEYLTPSEYPQLDEITEIDNAAATRELQAQVDLLTTAQDEAGGLTEKVTTLETALAEMTAERDALATEVGDANGATTDQQAALDAANEQVATLESELETARTDLTAANQKVTEAEAKLQTAVTERDAAKATIEALDITPNPNYINGPVTKARTDATANGWTLVEVPTESATAAPGTVLEQVPPANSNMIDGSVLYLKVAAAP